MKNKKFGVIKNSNFKDWNLRFKHNSGTDPIKDLLLEFTGKLRVNLHEHFARSS